MVELKSLLNFLRETGFGQLYGFYQQIKHMVHGQLLVKLILWNLEETVLPALPVVQIHLVPHFIGALLGIKTDGI